MAAGLKELAGEILARLEKGEGALLETQIRKEGLSRRLLPWSGEGFSCMLAGEEGVVLEPVVPEPRLLILGAGHISLALAEFAARAGFRVTVADDRPSFANPGRFPWAEGVLCLPFEEVFQEVEIHAATYVVIVTRGHQHDYLCLKKALATPAAYIGMIGSRRRVRGTLELLEGEGFSGEELERIHAPIGLPIASETPVEVAVSILAQLIQVRRSKGNLPEPEGEVLQALAREEDPPAAMATIIQAKGSVPRKSGARLLLRRDGRTLGTVGGGCGEGEVIQVARRLMAAGGHALYAVDLTAEVAAEEGMVCGGIMTLLVEAL